MVEIRYSLPLSRSAQITPAASFAAPRIRRAPVFRFGPKRSRACAKHSSTVSRLPITAPAVKYLTRRINIPANPISTPNPIGPRTSMPAV
ncbi:MAG: hypothetical protein ACNA8L_09125, partial [Luteolibacter sp.]